MQDCILICLFHIVMTFYDFLYEPNIYGYISYIFTFFEIQNAYL